MARFPCQPEVVMRGINQRALQGAIRRALVFEVNTYADDLVVRVPFQGKGKMCTVFREGLPQPNH